MINTGTRGQENRPLSLEIKEKAETLIIGGNMFYINY